MGGHELRRDGAENAALIVSAGLLMAVAVVFGIRAPETHRARG